MAKPILDRVTPFDAKTSHEFTYSWNDGIKEAILIIYDNRNMREIQRIQSMNGIIVYNYNPNNSSNNLVNGVKYSVQLRIKDLDGVWSEDSDKTSFFCISTPRFWLSRKTGEYTYEKLLSGYDSDNQVIENLIDSSNLKVSINYEQAELEFLHTYTVYLYGANASSLIFKSDEIVSYGNDELELPTLNNGDTYFVRAIGYTENGYECDTGLIKLFVKYSVLSNYSTLYLTNHENDGYIEYRTNFVIIQPTKKYFEYDGGYINLTHGDVLTYNKGFNINNDFALWVRGTGFTEEERSFYENVYSSPEDYRHDLLTIYSKPEDTDNSSIIRLEVHPYDKGLYRFILTVNDTPEIKDTPLLRILYSEPIPLEDEDVYLICIKCVNGVWGLYIQLEDSSLYAANYWIGNIRPVKELKDNDVWLDVGAVYDPYNNEIEPDTLKYVLAKDVVINDEEELSDDDLIENMIWIGGK